MMLNTLLALFSVLYCSYTYKMGLFVLDISNSQLLFNKRVAQTLKAAGHKVTIILVSTDLNRHGGAVNIREDLNVYSVNASRSDLSQDAVEEMSEELFFEDIPIYKVIGMVRMEIRMLMETCREAVTQPGLVEWLRKEEFDVVFVPMFDLCFVGLAYAAGIPGWIWLSSAPLMDHMSYVGGIPIMPSFMPPMWMEATDEMNFLERTKSTIGHALSAFMWNQLLAKPETQFFRELFSPDFPDLVELAARSPLIMANSNDFYELPRPTAAKIVNIGGVGIVNNSKLLPESLSKIMNAGDGAILVSFGSATPPHRMPIKWKKIFLNTFRRFPKYQFLFKYDKEDIAGMLPPNVHLLNWLPQTDVLHHPKTKAFISHCGYNSFQEVLLSGVPLLAFPLFDDQPKNARVARKLGLAVILRKDELSEEMLCSAIEEVTTNKVYAENARRLSRMVKLQPTSPAELLVKWSELVAEFHTMENLQSAGTNLNFFQYYSLDVLAFLFSTLVTLIVSVMLMVRLALRWIFSTLFRMEKQKLA